jgi:hypothetical protein
MRERKRTRAVALDLTPREPPRANRHTFMLLTTSTGRFVLMTWILAVLSNTPRRQNVVVLCDPIVSKLLLIDSRLSQAQDSASRLRDQFTLGRLRS